MPRIPSLWLLLVILLSGQAFAQKSWFTLVNDSGYTIEYMYVMPKGAAEWSDDVLGQDNLLPDKSVEVTWSGKKLPAIFDVHIRYEDGEECTIKGLSPPTKFHMLHIYYGDKTVPRWE